MRIKFICIFAFIYFNNCCGQSKFDDFLAYINSLPYNQKEIVVDSFLAASSYTENLFIADSSIYFYYLGEAEKVYIRRNINKTNNFQFLMSKVIGTEFHYYKWNLPQILIAQLALHLQVFSSMNRETTIIVDEYVTESKDRFDINSFEYINREYYYNLFNNISHDTKQ